MSASRQFVDSFGFSWQALEIMTRAGNGDGSGWLYFLARGATRRLRAYPAEWALLSWADLEDLLSQAEIVGSDAVAALPPRMAQSGSATV